MNYLRTCLPLVSILTACGPASSSDAGTDASSGDAAIRPMFVQSDWQVRCDSEMTTCPDTPARSITGEGGMVGNEVACTIVESADARVLSLRVGNEAGGVPFAFEVAGARAPRAGGFVEGAGCTVTVTEAGSRYTGACGGAPPSVEQPCQLSLRFAYDVSIDYTSVDVEGRCDHLPEEGAGGGLRSVTSPIDTVEFTTWRVFGCIGQSRD